MADRSDPGGDDNVIANYARAWDEWESDGEDVAWDVVVADGLESVA